MEKLLYIMIGLYVISVVSFVMYIRKTEKMGKGISKNKESPPGTAQFIEPTTPREEYNKSKTIDEFIKRLNG